MRIEDTPYLDFKDVLIKPKRSNLNSRSEVNLERTMICEKKISPLEYIFWPHNYQKDFEIINVGNNEVIRNLLKFCF